MLWKDNMLYNKNLRQQIVASFVEQNSSTKSQAAMTQARQR
jgi:hypothetical protein